MENRRGEAVMVSSGRRLRWFRQRAVPCRFPTDRIVDRAAAPATAHVIGTLRRRALLALFCLLAIAPSASASTGCGWVFWQNLGGEGRPSAWLIGRSFATLEECRARLREEVKLQMLGQYSTEVEDGVHTTIAGKIFWRRYYCVPGTIDPREPKGK